MFELLVFSHTRQLKQRLGISGVLTDIYSWRTINEDNIPGAQIDLVMERQDRTVNICEIKFSEDEYLIDNEYDRILRRKIEAYRRLKVSAKTSIQLTMITTYGLARGKYNGNVQNEVVLDDLFEP